MIPAHDQFAFTYDCLIALLTARNRATFEVIVVDDASTDGTRTLNELVQGVTVLRNEENRGFVHSCNRGAGFARGDNITLLNNDTEPTAGWLDEMLLVFRNFEGIGLVGSKLLYPDGTLQDAGGIIWSNGDAWNYGRGMPADHPDFCYTRQVDYLSGAAITIDRATWQEVGGFSEEFAPAYYEDTDLAFKVRKAGKRTVYAPLSVVIHHEGVSSGTDAGSGVKKHQAMNAPLFRAKWRRALQAQPRLDIAPHLAADHRGIRGRVLFVTEDVPRADSCLDGFRVIQDMRLLQSLGQKVTAFSERATRAPGDIEQLQRMGVESVGAQPNGGLSAFLKHRGSEFDIVYIVGIGTAFHVLADVRRWAPQAKVVLQAMTADLTPGIELGESDVAGRAATSAVRARTPNAISEVDLALSHTSQGASPCDARRAVMATRRARSFGRGRRGVRRPLGGEGRDSVRELRRRSVRSPGSGLPLRGGHASPAGATRRCHAHPPSRIRPGAGCDGWEARGE